MKISNLSSISTSPTSHNQSILKKVIAKNGDIPHITQIAQATLKPGDKVEAHAHKDLYEVFYIETGECEVIVNDKSQHLLTGDVITIEPGDEHEFVNNSGNSMTMFYFGAEV